MPRTPRSKMIWKEHRREHHQIWHSSCVHKCLKDVKKKRLAHKKAIDAQKEPAYSKRKEERRIAFEKRQACLWIDYEHSRIRTVKELLESGYVCLHTKFVKHHLCHCCDDNHGFEYRCLCGKERKDGY